MLMFNGKTIRGCKHETALNFRGLCRRCLGPALADNGGQSGVAGLAVVIALVALESPIESLQVGALQALA